jgi:hypothetical protein
MLCWWRRVGVLARLDVRGQLHECLGNVGSSFVGYGECVRLFTAEFVPEVMEPKISVFSRPTSPKV